MKAWSRIAAALMGTALVLYPLSLGRVTYVTGALAVAAFALLSLGTLSGSWSVVGAGMAAFVTEYTAVLLLVGGEIDVMAPVVGIAALTFVELMDLVGSTTPKVSLNASVAWARGAFAARTAAAGGVAATLALAGGVAVRGNPGLLLVIAAVCVLGAFAIAAGLATGALSRRPHR